MIWTIIVVIACLGVWLILRWVDRRSRVEVYAPGDDSRQLAKLKPYFCREVVEAKVRSLFPDHDPAEILQVLDNDVPSFWGLERMQLAVLKLSNGDMDKLGYYIGIARSERDFMKVVNLAEYPESSQRATDDRDLFWADHKREIERDFQQYLNWLKEE